MRLTAIRLHGFKSFADPTVFPVDAAVTGIIGPNGCGKSNIIDAVRWVLGESAAKQLRGASLADVIFAGSSGRRAAAQASVELHFDNADGGAGGAFAHFAELVVRRSVQSDGSSQYFINRERCRRRDIVELLQGTGVGARSYAVIEQGMVGRIVESKPEDLRAFVEEAAGVALYRSRRRDSERRMQEVRELLDRHEDRLQQLAKNRERLEKEAAAADIYRRLHGELSGHEYRLQSWWWHSAHQEHATLEKQYEAQEKMLAASMLAVQHSGAQAEALRHALRAAEAAFAPLEAASREAQAELARQQAEQSGLQTRCDYAARSVQQADERRVRLLAQAAQDDGEAQAHRDALALLHSMVGDLRQRLDSAQAVLHDDTQAAHAARTRLEQATALREQHRQHLAAQQARLQTLQRQQAMLETRLAESAVTTEELPDLEALAIEAESCALVAESSAEQWQSLQAQWQASEKGLQEIRDRVQAQAQALTASQSRADTLAQWQAAENHAPAAWRELPHLANALQVVPLWQEAVERHLDAALHALCAELPPGEASALGQAFVLEGGVPAGWQEIVQCGYGLHTWLEGLTPLAVHDDALDLHKLPQGKRFLTLSGSVASHSGLQPAGSEHAGTLARLAQLQALRDTLAEQEAQYQRLLDEQAQLENRHARLRDSLQMQEKQQAQHRREQQNAEHALLLARQVAAHREEMLAQQSRTQHSLRDDLAHNLAEQDALRDSLLALQGESHDISALQSASQSADTQRIRSEAHYQDIRTQLSQGEQEILRHQSWLDAQAQNAGRMQEALGEVLAQLQHEQMVLEESRLALEESALLLETLQEKYAQAEAAREEAFAGLGGQREALEAAQADYHQHQQAQALAEERRNHLHANLEQLAEKILELDNLFAGADRKPLRFQEGEHVDARRLQEDIRRLRAEIARLGAVNMAAVEAFAEADKEFQELFRQCHDLQESLRLLEEAIAELDAQTRERLHATFDTVNRYFGEYFPLLFRGGDAHLTWTDSDILNAGITIHVRPPGKNVKQLSVLSGGEKALTAVALVFSFFRLNPAPFCLLDEVDAPLDDANVARLNALLRDMARDTQFVMITHHKRSMQACDHLIGVTMSEPGVSRLVSVKFEDALPEA